MKGLIQLESGLIPIYKTKDDERLVNARELYEFLGIKRQFADWIKDKISKYEFVKDEDYFSLSQKCEGNNATKIDYILKIDTAKEIAMVENNNKGRQIRRYFIEVEKRYRESYQSQIKVQAIREAGKLTRRELTDTIKSLIPESPHKKFAFPNYTKLIYKIALEKTVNELRTERNIPKEKIVRDYLNADELAEVKRLEDIVISLINLGMGYEEIKKVLSQRYRKMIA